MSNFITEINIKKVRHLENIDIVLGDEKKHLILTGKNGSGKTSVLEEFELFG
jgi:recombinational DNA repair ATPase RecF